MSVVRATLLLCVTLLVSVGVFALIFHDKDRLVIVGQNEGVFLLDRKTSSVSFCDSKGCRLVGYQGNQYNDASPYTQYPQGIFPTPLSNSITTNNLFPNTAGVPYYMRSLTNSGNTIGFHSAPSPIEEAPTSAPSDNLSSNTASTTPAPTAVPAPAPSVGDNQVAAISPTATPALTTPTTTIAGNQANTSSSTSTTAPAATLPAIAENSALNPPPTNPSAIATDTTG